MGRHPCGLCRRNDWDYTESHCPNDACEYYDCNELCLESVLRQRIHTGAVKRKTGKVKSACRRGVISVSRIIVANVQ